MGPSHEVNTCCRSIQYVRGLTPTGKLLISLAYVYESYVVGWGGGGNDDRGLVFSVALR